MACCVSRRRVSVEDSLRILATIDSSRTPKREARTSSSTSRRVSRRAVAALCSLPCSRPRSRPWRTPCSNPCCAAGPAPLFSFSHERARCGIACFQEPAPRQPVQLHDPIVEAQHGAVGEIDTQQLRLGLLRRVDDDGVDRQIVVLEDRREVAEETPREVARSRTLVFDVNDKAGFTPLEAGFGEDVGAIDLAVKEADDLLLVEEFRWSRDRGNARAWGRRVEETRRKTSSGAP